MAIRYTQSDEPFKQRRFNGMKFHRALIATTKREADERANYHRGHGALVKVVHTKQGYELYTR